MSELPEDFTPLEERPSRIDDSRRRRKRRFLVPAGKSERALYVGEIARRLVPGVDFFLFSMLSGLVIALGILLDSPAIFILAALLAPFMAPVVGLGFSAAVGSLRFFLQSIGGLLIGSIFVFAGGALGGWFSKLFIDLPLLQARRFTGFTIPDFLLLTIGAGLAIYLTVRVPKQRSLVASVPLAYEIYIPIGIAGFGLTSAIQGFFPQALSVAGVYIAWVILVGTIVLAVMKLRPFTFFGYLLTAIILGAAIYTLVVSSALGSALQKQLSPFITQTSITQSETLFTETPTLQPSTKIVQQPTETPTPTNTLVPTRTATVTITPKPTPVWAMINSPNGVIVRKTPGGEYLTSLEFNSPVQVLPDVVFQDPLYWAHVILSDGREAWIVRSWLTTATPSPDW